MRLRLKATVAWLALVLPLMSCSSGNSTLPMQIEQVFAKPLYANAVWSLRVVDLDSGRLIYDRNPDLPLLIGSVRKLFSVGVALDALGPDHAFRTPVYRRGTMDGAGVLHGDLILVASGDPAMGGRTRPDGSLAVTEVDHNEANSLGSPQLPDTDPLAGYAALARQVAAAGIRRVEGDVIIDDRLFQPFRFRGEFDVRPIFVNDDVVDVIIRPTTPGNAADIDWRPKSAAFTVRPGLSTVRAGAETLVEVEPDLPACIGFTPCEGHVTGKIAADFVPPLTARLPLIRTFRIVQPANYARTVFIEALNAAGVAVAAQAVAANPAQALPPRDSYVADARVAELTSAPFREFARYILKVSYNIGADLSTMLYGLTQGVTTFEAALAAEKEQLARNYGILPGSIQFVDGSGGDETRATSDAVIGMLRAMRNRPSFADYFAALPHLGVDGSLGTVTAFANDPALAGARGQVQAKTGTFIEGTP
jgi:D-alanyl-D-alanine carboxypeptidase/D-alanyl-D-alanine-endopeptidase (penicillin-binding protein 4)